jgi:hypothetical protein
MGPLYDLVQEWFGTSKHFCELFWWRLPISQPLKPSINQEISDVAKQMLREEATAIKQTPGALPMQPPLIIWNGSENSGMPVATLLMWCFQLMRKRLGLHLSIARRSVDAQSHLHISTTFHLSSTQLLPRRKAKSPSQSSSLKILDGRLWW